jgi:AmmeMemoRadiSam system protein A
MRLAEQHRQQLLDIARRSIRRALNEPRNEGGWFRKSRRDDLLPPIDPPGDEELQQPAGCFVSLHDLGSHRLRGCVGRLEARDPVWKAVAQTAVDVLHDPRFYDMPVTIDDLPTLELEISLLSPLMHATDPLDFDLLEDGIVLSCNGHSGCFLPQVARETGWTKEQLLDRLCSEKLGMKRDAWRAPAAKLEKFSTLIIGPEAFEPLGTVHST